MLRRGARPLQVVVAVLLILGVAAVHVQGEGEVDAKDKGTPITFQAEVAKMLDILINSLYTNRNIFLRELISNGSDALDKIRVMYLTNRKTPVNLDGVAPTMDMRITFNEDDRELILRDGGIGMTKEELSAHLGSLGTSGTKRFLEGMRESSTPANTDNLIGQFGVGFYSVFLVADRVRVASKSDDSDTQTVWESSGDGNYFLYEDPRGNTLGRGTEITITLKADASEYLQVDTIKDIIHQYSEFINFPIYVEESEEAQENKKWTLVNENRPIWTRAIGQVTEEEYFKFYKALTRDYNDPMYFSHFKVEGEVEFESILFIPAESTRAMFSEESLNSKNIKLYVRRVFITDDFRDLLPRYLNFVKGVVDSNDLPLNVSREVLQESRILRVIKKKLVRKALFMLSDIAAQDERVAKAQNMEGKEQPAAKNTGSTVLQRAIYNDRLWKQFGKHIRMGVMEDSNNRGRLVKLLRYHTTKSEDKLIGLQTYLERMQKGQKGIYYITGDSLEKAKQSPMLQDAARRNVEVIFMTDAIDEYVVSHVPDFAGKKLINLAKEGVQFDDVDPRHRAIEKKRKEKYAPLLTRLRLLFGAEAVRKAVLTKRYTTEAFILSSGEHQLTARLANMIRGQAMNWDGTAAAAERVLEVNFRHPLVEEIYRRMELDESDPVAEDIAWVLYDTANLQSDFPVADVAAYAARLNRLLRSSVDIDTGVDLLDEDDTEFLAAIDAEEATKAEAGGTEEEGVAGEQAEGHDL